MIRMRHVLRQGVADDDFTNPHDIFVSAGDECIDLAQSGDGKAVLLLVELQLLERDDVPCLFVLRTENDAVGPFFNGVQALIAVDRSRRDN